MDQERLNSLISKLRQDRLSAEEQSELDEQLLADPEGKEVRSVLEEMMINTPPADSFDTVHWENISRRLLTVDKMISQGKNANRTIHLHDRWKWAAAAVLVLLCGSGIWFFTNRPSQKPAIAHTINIMPGTNKAVLTLADGSTVTLDSSGNQTMQQGNTVVYQQGSQLRYDAREENGPAQLNTLATPRGGQFHLELPDGSKVWLNAASSLKYPVAFNEKERIVSVTGEAYFEVAQNAGRPFIVQFKVPGTGENASVEVLGTSFNINAYTNEASAKTTLATGKVRVLGNNNMSAILAPGQQAVLSNKLSITDGQSEAALAWIHGAFNFRNSSLEELLRQLERWYDIDIVYANGVPDLELSGEMSRSVPLEVLLKALKRMGLEYKMDGKKMTVLSTSK